MVDIAERAPREKSSLLTDPRARSILIQATLLIFVVGFGWYFVENARANLATQRTPRQSYSFFGLAFANNRGLVLPEAIFNEGSGAVGIAFLAALALALIVRYWARWRQMRTGQIFPTGRVALALILGLPLIVYLLLGAPIRFDL